MGTKVLTFDELPQVESFEADAEYSYESDSGKIHGRPEDCYPPSTHAELYLEDGWQQRLKLKYDFAYLDAVKQIEAKIQEHINDDVAMWAEEDAINAVYEAADAAFERQREER